jgi:L-ascorbate metabolism protein UlaG (beta-lactamase superfamily)
VGNYRRVAGADHIGTDRHPPRLMNHQNSPSRRTPAALLLALVALQLASACASAAPPASPAASVSPPSSEPHVDLTWLSMANVHFQIGSLGVLGDGYVTRLPQSTFLDESLVRSTAPALPDTAMVASVLGAIGGAPSVQLILSGHSHFDHSFDTAVWSRLTGSRIIGPASTCFQTLAQEIPAARCTTVLGGEEIPLGASLTMRVVRWNHSGDPTLNPDQHNPSELLAPPRRDPATGGLQPGLGEDFPNGGGGRGYLFTLDGPDGRVSWFWQNSASPVNLHLPIVVNGTSYGAPLDNLRAAMRDAGLESVDLWIGTGGAPIAALVLPVLKPKAYLPIHWDGLFAPFLGGVPAAYADTALEARLTRDGVRLVRPQQYLDRWRLDRAGVHPIANDSARLALGLPAPPSR